MCGGTAHAPPHAGSGTGLSPRVRGNPALAPTVIWPVGSIPACAGEPLLKCALHFHTQVYPRVCGGTTLATWGQVLDLGLSPRVRGNLPPTTIARPMPRSIPACAGEPGRDGGREGRGRVYPRVCGGTGQIMGLVSLRGGSIPACAGEPALKKAAGGPEVGLSPRVRGNPGMPGLRRTGRRSIPACAGEPTGSSRPRLSGPVYPRVCGGTVHHDRDLDSIRGLSPRVRGNLFAYPNLLTMARSIPACAGEPIPMATGHRR